MTLEKLKFKSITVTEEFVEECGVSWGPKGLGVKEHVGLREALLPFPTPFLLQVATVAAETTGRRLTG